MKVSATVLGERTGMDTGTVYRKLVELGLVTGGPNAWTITAKGQRYGEERFQKTGNVRGGCRGYHYLVWDEELASEIGDPGAWRKFVDSNRKAAGLPPKKW